jgi:NAD(P)H dehydrogenase (quinone)
VKVLTVYWSRYGHTLQMARAVHEGVDSVSGVEAVLRRVEEFPGAEDEISKSRHASAVWEQQKDIRVCTVEDLRQARGVLLGSPGMGTWRRRSSGWSTRRRHCG